MNEWEYFDGKPSVADLETILQTLVSDIPLEADETYIAETGRLRIEREVIQEEGQDEPLVMWNYYLRID